MASMGGIAGVLFAIGDRARGQHVLHRRDPAERRGRGRHALHRGRACFSASTPPARRPGSTHRSAADRRIETHAQPTGNTFARICCWRWIRCARHKFRSFLTVLGVLIGTTTVIAVTSIIAGLDKQLVDVAEQFGTRTLWVYKLQMGAPHALTREERLRKPLSYEDAMAIKEQVPSASTVSVELFREMGEFGLPPVTARYKGQDMLDALFVGVTADHLRLINATLGEGRFFTETDDLHRRDVAVIGNGVRERFFAHADPIGKTILVDGHSLEVVGTLTKFKSFLGDDQNDKAILIPYQLLQEGLPRGQGQLHLRAGGARQDGSGEGRSDRTAAPPPAA